MAGTRIQVKYGAVTDALGRKREGWLIIENGLFHPPLPTKEAAIHRAESIAELRIVNGRVAPIEVIE